MAEQNKTVQDNETLKQTIQTLKEELENERTERSKEEKKCKSLEVINTKLEKEKHVKDLNISEKEKTIYDLQRKIREIQGELDRLKCIRVLQVQILSRYGSDIMKSATDELAEALIKNVRDCELEIIKCMKASEIQPDKPLLLLCIGTHAISLEIQNTLRGLPVSRKTAVVVIHLKAEHALPVQPSDRILTNKEFESIGGIFDIGFLQDKKLYQCQVNDANITSIVNFIHRVGDKKPKEN